MGPFIAYSRPMRHIDRKDLYTSLEARIQYLHTFLDFGSSEYRTSVGIQTTAIR